MAEHIIDTYNNGDRSLRSVAIVVAAAGSGQRFGGALPKAFESIGERSLLEHCLRSIARVRDPQRGGVGALVVVVPQGFESQAELMCEQAELAPGTEVRVVVGGAQRHESVACALEVLPADISTVLVHDAARAFTPVDQYERVIAAVQSGLNAVIPVLPVVDTLKQVAPAVGDQDEAGLDTGGLDAGEEAKPQRVIATVDRSVLRAVQTPQGFTRDLLTRAHRSVSGEGITDDAGMVESLGVTVNAVIGDRAAFKVTTPFDRLVAQALIDSSPEL